MTKKIQGIRNVVQLAFIGLFIAGLYMDLRMVLILLLPAALLFGNYFCGWVCPYGSMQEFFGALGGRINKKKLKMPRAVQKYLQFSRYVLAIILMTGFLSFVLEPLNAYKIFMGLDLTRIAMTIPILIMVSFLLISMFFERPFCNYVCTEAAKYGLASMARIFTIKRNVETCISCRNCDKACPMNIGISDKSHVRNGQCLNCFECISACPVKNTLSYGFVKYSFPKKSKGA